MKNKYLLSVGLLLLFVFTGWTKVTSNEKDTQKMSISVLSTSEVQNLTNDLIRKYREANPEITVETEQILNSDIAKVFSEGSKVVIASEKLDEITSDKPLWKIIIGRDVIVPVISVDNPLSNVIDKQGITTEKLSEIVSGKYRQEWGVLLGNDEKHQVRICILDDEIVRESVTKFLGVNSMAIAEIEKVSAGEMKQVLQNDKYAIGFCRLLDVTEANGQNIASGVKLLPLDKNGNGVLEYHEKIYSDLDKFRRAVWIGKYPHTLIQNIYAVADVLPEDEKLLDFLGWVVTDGQKIIGSAGFTELVYNERQAKLDKITPSQLLTETTIQTSNAKSNKAIFFIALGIIVLVLIPGIFFRDGKNKIRNLAKVHSRNSQILSESILKVPSGLYFDKTHTWSFMEKNGTVRVGIDDFLQHVTGIYTNIKMKEPGERIKKNEPLLTLVQKGKQINIYAPISGKIKEINEDLVTEPSLINSSPYEEGWIYMVEPSNWQREIGFLKMADIYSGWLKKEISRFKDFLSAAFNSQYDVNGQLVLQEGGEINDHALEELGPVVWEDFQKNFIDNSDIN